MTGGAAVRLKYHLNNVYFYFTQAIPERYARAKYHLEPKMQTHTPEYASRITVPRRP